MSIKVTHAQRALLDRIAKEGAVRCLPNSHLAAALLRRGYVKWDEANGMVRPFLVLTQAGEYFLNRPKHK